MTNQQEKETHTKTWKKKWKMQKKSGGGMHEETKRQ